MFSDKDLRKLIIPFFLEQLLMALVGMADIFIIGNCIGVFMLHAGVAGVAWPSLIYGRSGMRHHGTGLYYCDRTMYGSRRCKLHHCNILIYNHRSPAYTINPLWYHFRYGCHGNRACHVSGLDSQRDYLLDPIQTGKMETV